MKLTDAQDDNLCFFFRLILDNIVKHFILKKYFISVANECVLRGVKWRCCEKNLSLCLFPTTHSTWTGVEFNPGLCDERPAANCQSQGTPCNGVRLSTKHFSGSMCMLGFGSFSKC